VLQLTDFGLGVEHPEWSPDGQRIVFDIVGLVYLGKRSVSGTLRA